MALGWRHLGMTTKHDNSNPAAKIALRKHFLGAVPSPRVLECFAGVERQMYHAVYEGYDTTSLDLKGGPGVVKIDNRQYLRRHADEYNYFDLDAYGSPFQGLITLVHYRQSEEPFVVVMTDGQKLKMNYKHGSSITAAGANLPPDLIIPCLPLFQEEIIGYILRAIARRYALEITGAKIARGDTGNMKYYGFIVRKCPDSKTEAV